MTLTDQSLSRRRVLTLAAAGSAAALIPATLSARQDASPAAEERTPKAPLRPTPRSWGHGTAPRRRLARRETAGGRVRVPGLPLAPDPHTRFRLTYRQESLSAELPANPTGPKRTME